jgi:hypothetical protein
VAGKTGADAVGTALHHVCRVVIRFRAKLDAIIDAAVTANVITSAEGAVAHTFVSTAGDVCKIFEAIAVFNSVAP